jgi:hypothetical protein
MKNIYAMVLPLQAQSYTFGSVSGDTTSAIGSVQGTANCVFLDKWDAVVQDGALKGQPIIELQFNVPLQRLINLSDLWRQMVEEWIAHESDPLQGPWTSGATTNGWLRDYNWDLKGVVVLS